MTVCCLWMCLRPVDVPEELAGKEYYYALYTVDAIYGWDDETLYSQLYDYGTDYAPTYFLSDYGMEFVLVGFAVDDNGDWGPIWKSEPFTMSPCLWKERLIPMTI